MAGTTIIRKLSNGNVFVDKGGDGDYSFAPDKDVYNLPERVGIEVRHKNGSRQAVFLVDEVDKVVRKDGTEVSINDASTLFNELINFFFFKLASGGSGTGQGYIGVFQDFNALITAHPTADLYDLAYVENSQGTAWLPGSMLGTYYSKGTYLWNGTAWESGVDEISQQLEDNINDIIFLNNTIVLHIGDLNNPHDTSLSNLTDIPAFPNDGNDYVLVENSNAVTWQEDKGSSLLAVVDVDCTLVGGHVIYTVPTGKKIFFNHAYGLLKTVSGGSGIAKNPKVSIGVNGASDLYSNTRIVGVNSVNDYYHFNSSGNKRLADSTNTIDLLVNLQSNAIAYVLTIYIYGNEY